MSTPQTAPSTGTGADTAPPRRCENCGEVLLGEHCYNCGQPTKGLIRQFSAIIGDFADTVLNIDSRIIHTVGPLLFKPGFLSLEYFAGRRVRYVSPVRLLFFVSVATFLFAQWLTPDWNLSHDGDDTTLNFGSDSNGFGSATTVADVVKQRDAALAKIDARGAKVPGLDEALSQAKAEVRAAADRRIKQLQKTAKTPSAKASPPPDSKPSNEPEFDFDGKPWDANKHPVQISWLPSRGNTLLNQQIGRAKANVKRVREDPNLLKNAIFNTLPTTLFVLVPVFALLLKMLYLFKRRLYMEHLVVALHSHAFMCLSVLLMIVTGSLGELLAPASGVIHSGFGLVEFALGAWMPLYLLLMQKRIYGQGWPMTLIKYALLGFLYVILLSFGMAGTMMVALVWM
jgi:hypothetical protein